ncbi:MAG: FliG C-terminal domain-containing protein [Nitrospirota bacterium]|nr:FliG C-terminal domain-containing protein [Nitrospirota bacterium]
MAEPAQEDWLGTRPEYEASRVDDVVRFGEPRDKRSGGDESTQQMPLDSLTKALVIYSIMPKDMVAAVSQSLSPETLETLLKAKSERRIEGFSEDTVTIIVDEFIFLIGHVLGVLQEKGERATQGEQKQGEAPSAPEAEEPAPTTKEWFSFLEHLDREWLLELLIGENPQVIAVVLSYVNREHAAYALSRLPVDKRAEVVERMVRLGSVAPTVLDSLEGILRERLKEFVYGVVVGERAGSLDQVSQILNRLEEADVRTILQKIGTKDQELAKALEGKLLTFEDLNLLDSRDMQRLLRGVDINQLALALKGASEQMRQKVLSNLSTRARDVLRDELEALGPKRLSQIEKAQKSIVESAKELASLLENPITLPTVGGGDLVVQ